MTSLVIAWIGTFSVFAQASEIKLTPRELFRVPFGEKRETLGSRREGGNFIFPRDFTMDDTGHFYIYDSPNHRIARFSSEGKYEMGLAYLPTAKQVFAHADDHQNLWLLISDPAQGIYYGVYDAKGKLLRSGIFSRFNRFRLHLDEDSALHVILTSDKDPALQQIYILDEATLLMKKESIATPSETHHEVKKSERLYFVDEVPGASKDDLHRVNRVTDSAHRPVASIEGTVIYVTSRGDIYTRLSERDLRIYDVDGTLKGNVHLTGLASTCAAIRFDAEGNLYQLDGIPDKNNEYTADMPGMRLIQWGR